MRIIIAGGHLTPAYALLEYLKTTTADEALYIGREFASIRFGIKSREQQAVEELGFQYASLPELKYDRYNKLISLIKFPLLIGSVTKALNYINQFSPDIVVSFGSYVSVPVVIAAAIRKIPVVLHEQTVAAGLANRISAPFARHIVISHESSRSFFPSSKVVLLGNLVRAAFFNPTIEKPDWLSQVTVPILYVTGGSQGSVRLNEVIGALIPELVKTYCVVHQVGNSDVFKPMEQFSQLRESLSRALRSHYVVKEWVSVNDAAWLMRHAEVIISRAGANTVTEIMVSGTPAIFVPLPNTNQNEQFRNARLLVENESAYLIPQLELTPERLHKTLQYLEKNYDMHKKHAQKLQSTIGDVVPKFYGILKDVA